MLQPRLVYSLGSRMFRFIASEGEENLEARSLSSMASALTTISQGHVAHLHRERERCAAHLFLLHC